MVQRASYNYHHFVLEIATSALLWRREGVLEPDRPLIIAATPFAEELLGLAGVTSRVRGLARNSLVLLRHSRVLQSTPAGFLAPELIEELSSRVTTAVRDDDGGPRVVYLQRPASQRRSLSNEAEVLGAMRSVLGPIAVVDPGSLSVRDQVRAVRSARIIIGPHGAQLTNLVWARRAEALVELLHYRLPDYQSLAGVRGVEYRAVRGDAFDAPDHDRPFRCDPEEVAEALRSLR